MMEDALKQASKEDLKILIRGFQKTNIEQQNQIDKLEEYINHKDDCAYAKSSDGKVACDCGFDELNKDKLDWKYLRFRLKRTDLEGDFKEILKGFRLDFNNNLRNIPKEILDKFKN